MLSNYDVECIIISTKNEKSRRLCFRKFNWKRKKISSFPKKIQVKNDKLEQAKYYNINICRSSNPIVKDLFKRPRFSNFKIGKKYLRVEFIWESIFDKTIDINSGG